MTCSDQANCCSDWEDPVDLTTQTFHGTWSLGDSSVTSPPMTDTSLESTSYSSPDLTPEYEKKSFGALETYQDSAESKARSGLFPLYHRDLYPGVRGGRKRGQV